MARPKKQTLEEKRAYQREWARKDRLRNPGKYKPIDAKKVAKIAADPIKAEKERKRNETRQRKKRAHLKANDPEGYAKLLATEKASKAKRKKQPDYNEQIATINENRRAKYAEQQQLVLAGILVRDPVNATQTCVSTLCVLCKNALAWTYDRCETCMVGFGRVKVQETEIGKFLEENGLHPSLRDHTGPCRAQSDSARRPDFVLKANDVPYTIVVEVDEDYHRGYPAECEVKRMQQIKDAFPEEVLYFVRYAPERIKYKEHGETRLSVILPESKALLLECVRTIIALPKPEPKDIPLGYKVRYLGYPPDRVRDLEETHVRMVHEAEAAVASSASSSSSSSSSTPAAMAAASLMADAALDAAIKDKEDKLEERKRKDRERKRKRGKTHQGLTEEQIKEKRKKNADYMRDFYLQGWCAKDQKFYPELARIRQGKNNENSTNWHHSVKGVAGKSADI